MLKKEEIIQILRETIKVEKLTSEDGYSFKLYFEDVASEISNRFEDLVVADGEQYNLLIDTINDLLYNDPHQFSKRPCQTCQAITSIMKKPFGCNRKAKEQ